MFTTNLLGNIFQSYFGHQKLLLFGVSICSFVLFQMNITPRKAMSQGSQDSYVTRMLLTQKSTASGNEDLRVTVRLTIAEVTCKAKPEADFI